MLVDLATVAATAELELSVVSLTPTRTAENAIRLRALGVPLTEVEFSSRWDPRGLPQGTRAIIATRPDIVHSHLKHADLVGAVAARRLGVPLVSTLHLIEDSVPSRGIGKRWLAAQVRGRRAAATVAVSDALREWYLRAFPVDPRRVRTVRNGIVAPVPDAAAAAAVRKSLHLAPEAVVAAMVGIMRPGKGHAELLDAIPHVGGNIHFVLVGDGPLRHQLEFRAAALPPGRVTFLGYRTDVADLLAAADLVVHPSRFDALPTALICALAVGRPVVASAVGGIPEIVTRDVGRLVPAGDLGALAAEVTALAVDPQTRAQLGAAGRRRFEAEFEAGQWVGRLRELYDEVRAPCAASA